MKKYLFLIFSLIFIVSITSCNKITDPLDNKSGTWIGTLSGSAATMTITFDKEGKGTYSSNVDHSTNNPHTIQLIKVNDSTYTFSLENYTEDFKITFNNDSTGVLDTPNTDYSRAQFTLNKKS